MREKRYERKKKDLKKQEAKSESEGQEMSSLKKKWKKP